MRKRISMKKVIEILRLRFKEGLSIENCAKGACVGKATAHEVLKRAELLNINLSSLSLLTEEEIENILYPVKEKNKNLNSSLPDWVYIKNELMRKGVTLHILWLEYKKQFPEGLQYTQFCVRYKSWTKQSKLSMRQNHIAGEKVFVDYSGLRQEYLDIYTGEIKYAEIFIGVLGASNYTFAIAVKSQTKKDWIYANNKMLEYFGGVPRIIVPDNLKSAVTSACKYEPDLNPSYREFAQYYSVAVIPTRARKPKDKGKVEVGVQIAQRWILARIRKQTFSSIEEINKAILPLLKELNLKVMRHLGVSRSELFEKYEKPALRQLPEYMYELAEWKQAKVNIDYHVEFEKHYYSVPHKHIHEKVELRSTRSMVEIFYLGKRIALHPRSFLIGKHSTISDHMPISHKEQKEWTPDRMLDWARNTGTEVEFFVQLLLEKYEHPQQGFRAALGIFRFAKTYSDARVNAACKRAIHYGDISFKSVRNILKNNLDKIELTENENTVKNKIVDHENIRGSSYFN